MEEKQLLFADLKSLYVEKALLIEKIKGFEWELLTPFRKAIKDKMGDFKFDCFMSHYPTEHPEGFDKTHPEFAKKDIQIQVCAQNNHIFFVSSDNLISGKLDKWDTISLEEYNEMFGIPKEVDVFSEINKWLRKHKDDYE